MIPIKEFYNAAGKKIGFIGGGNMGEALVSGLVLSQATRPENIICSDIDPELLEAIQKKYGVNTTPDNLEVVRQSDIIVYAVKPQILGMVLKQTAPALDETKLIISIAAGVPLAAIAHRAAEKAAPDPGHAKYLRLCQGKRHRHRRRGICTGKRCG
jgi:pyrroline-5-carboxylate reductase